MAVSTLRAFESMWKLRYLNIKTNFGKLQFYGKDINTKLKKLYMFQRLKTTFSVLNGQITGLK